MPVEFFWPGQGFVPIAVSSIRESLVASHRQFAEDLDVGNRPASLHLPTHFEDDAELAHVLDEVARVAACDVKTCAAVGTRFVGIEIGPGRPVAVPLNPSAMSAEATGIARRIVGA